MSIILARCGERPVAREAEESSSKEDALRQIVDKTKRRVFYVETNDKRDDDTVVLTCPIIPAMFATYQTATTFDTDLLVIRRSPKQIGPCQWEVTVEYGVPKISSDGGGTGGGGSAEYWDKAVALDFIEYDEALDGKIWLWGLAGGADPNEGFGVGGVPAVNSAGDPFTEPITVKRYSPVLTHTVYSSYVNPSFILKYIGAVNSDPFFGCNPRQLRITQWTVPNKEYQIVGRVRIGYYTHTIKMAFKEQTWDISPVSKGPNFLESAYAGNGETTTYKRAFIGKNGQPYIGFLRENGRPLEPDSNGQFTQDFHYMGPWRHYRELPFGQLGLLNGFP